jgi:hypothetical protein
MSNQYSKPKFEASELGYNPFVINLEVRVNRVAYRGSYRKDVNGKEVPNVSEFEYDKLCKLFTSKDNRDIINRLTPRAKELLVFIMFQIQSGDDFLWINRVMYMDENGVSSMTTFTNCVKELVHYGILAHTTIKRDVYWINPDLLFKGNRITKYPNNIVEKS